MGQVLKLNERLRRSIEHLEIKRSVELLQESKTGKMSDIIYSNPNNNPKSDLNLGGPPGSEVFFVIKPGNVAHISTEIFHEGTAGERGNNTGVRDRYGVFGRPKRWGAPRQ